MKAKYKAKAMEKRVFEIRNHTFMFCFFLKELLKRCAFFFCLICQKNVE